MEEYRSLIEEYADRMKAHFENRLISICFFGSVVRGDATASSDIDVLVVAEDLPVDIGSRVHETSSVHDALKATAAYQALKKLKRSALISDIFLTPPEVEEHPPILLDMVDDGLILFDRGNFLRDVLSSLKERLQALGSKKVKTAKGWYWILKPGAKPTELVEL